MRYRPFGKTGLQVSVVGFGCWPMAGDRYGAIEDDEAVKAIHRALDRGVNCVDTAPAYGAGHSEEVVARALEHRRREVILVAAEETFARSGYHGASLDDIAHAAGVSKALIYEHFESKRELHGSLLDAQAAEIFRRLEAAAARGETGEERLRNGIDAFLCFVEERDRKSVV